MYYNNMGCIHYRMHKYSLAGLYFSKALQANEDRISLATSTAISTDDSGKKVNVSKTHGKSSGDTAAKAAAKAAADASAARNSLFYFCDKKADILYNCGLQFYASNNPALASECLQESARIYTNQPVIWLRIAECSVAAYQQSLKTIESSNSSTLVRAEFGAKSRRRFVLASSAAHAGHPASHCLVPFGADEKHASGMSNGNPTTESTSVADGNDLDVSQCTTPSLAYAQRCLRTCLNLLQTQQEAAIACATSEHTSDDDDPEDDAKSSRHQHQSTTPASRSVLDHLKEHAELLMAYVLLCLNEPLNGELYARSVCESKSCPPYYRLLASMYRAEALCLLKRDDEAIACLDPSTFAADCFEAPASLELFEPHASVVGSLSQTDGIVMHLVHNDTAKSDSLHANIEQSALGTTTSEHNSPSNSARVSLFTNLAVLSLLKGDESNAREQLSRALLLDRTYPPALRALVFLELRSGDASAALHVLKRRRPLPCVLPNSSAHGQ
jgi:CCR4-NOT transcription complex subunit 10